MINNDQLFQYLEKKIPTFVKTRKAKSGELLFTCPNFVNHKFKSAPSATFSPSGNIVCLICGWKGTLYDAIRVVELNYANKTDAEITAYLIEELGLTMYSELDVYQKYGWSLVCLLKNTRDAFEDGWRTKEHKDKIQ